MAVTTRARGRSTEQLEAVIVAAAAGRLRPHELHGLVDTMRRDHQIVHVPGSGWTLSPTFEREYGPALRSCGFEEDLAA